jgi:Transposase and inactivated derivatives
MKNDHVLEKNNAEMVTISRAEYEQLKAQNEWLLEQLRVIKSKQFGSSTEKASEEVIGQLSLLFNEPEVYADDTEKPEEPVVEVRSHTRKPKSGSARDIVPGNAKVVENTHELPEAERLCPECGEVMQPIGKEVREKIQIIPAQVILYRDVYITYACQNCKENNTVTPILQTPKEPALIPGSFASAEAVAHFAVQKFVMGSPLYRQEQEWNRQGFRISRQTMSNWMLRSTEDWLTPVYDELHKQLLRHDLLHADETELQVLHEEGRDAKAKSYMWLYRTSGDAKHPIVLYEYAPGRGHEYPKEFLKDFHGYLQTDGYSGYNGVDGAIHVGCWAHARRRFDEALRAVPKGKRAPTAEQGVAYCSQLFKLEEKLKSLSPEERKAKRQEQKEVLDAMLAWANTRNAAPKSKLGEALNYLKNHWSTLIVYLEDGRIELSNNRAERSIKPFVISRKNFLFANTAKGAQGSAVMFSLIETAKENGLDPYRYLVWVLNEAPKRSSDNTAWAATLLPQNAPQNCKADAT